MAFCDARAIELKEAVDKPNAAPETPSESELKALRAAVAAWGATRSECLSTLCKDLEPATGAGARKWQSTVDRFADGAARFGEAIRNVSGATGWAKRFVQMNYVADAKFANALEKAMLVAETRDYLIGHLEVLEKQKSDLEKSWDKIIGDHKTFEEREKNAIEEIQRLEKEAAYEAQQFVSKLAHELADRVLWLKKEVLDKAPKGMKIPWKSQVEIIALAISYYRATRGRFDAAVIKTEALFRQETGSVLFLFKEFREDTKEFIEKYGYKVAEEKFKAADDALKAMVSDGGTSSGNKADAEKFTEAARILLAGHLNRVKQSWDSFVEKHEKKFFGPVGPDIRRALLDRDTFEDKYESIIANNLYALAEKWRNDARAVITTSIDGLEADAKALLREALTNDLRALEDALTERPSASLEKIKDAIEDADKEIR